MDCPEFTSLCPKTCQPDFGTIKILHPDQVNGEADVEKPPPSCYPLIKFMNS